MPKTVIMSQPTKESLMNDLLTNVKIRVRALVQPTDGSEGLPWFSSSVAAPFNVDEFVGEANKIAELTSDVVIEIPLADVETAVGKEVSTINIDRVDILYSDETLLAFEGISVDQPIFSGTGELTITDFDIFMANFQDLED